jgi:hypothetical protein
MDSTTGNKHQTTIVGNKTINVTLDRTGRQYSQHRVGGSASSALQAKKQMQFASLVEFSLLYSSAHTTALGEPQVGGSA